MSRELRRRLPGQVPWFGSCTWHQANEVLDRALGIAELVQAGVDRLAEIVRRDVRGHAHGDVSVCVGFDKITS